MSTTEYAVRCISCEAVFTPGVRSPLWWQAKKYAEAGYIDALPISGENCGCCPKEEKSDPNAPYRVFGYDDIGNDFDLPFHSFTEAAKTCRDLNSSLCVVFISGVSSKVESRLRLGC